MTPEFRHHCDTVSTFAMLDHLPSFLSPYHREELIIAMLDDVG